MLIEESITHPLSELAVDDNLLFHYTSAATLKAILTTGNIRLNTLDRMNDPRERKEWVARELVLPEGKVTWESLTGQGAVASEVDRLLRLGARIACFTGEREPKNDAAPGALFHRGWARARMWYQYAEDHAGACLVFQRDQLVESIDKARRLANGDVLSVSRVRYLDKPLKVPIRGAIPNIAAMQEALDTMTGDGKIVADLFFTKNTDWQSEDEVRILVLLWDPSNGLEPEPLDFPFKNSLKAIVLGEEFGEPDWLDDALSGTALPADQVLRASWVDGAPVLRPRTEEWTRLI